MDERTWKTLDIPPIYGMATYEWNILEGTTWYSEGWRRIIQEDYDDSTPNDKEWWDARVHPGDRQNIYRSVLAIHAGFLDRYETVMRFKRADGVWITLLSRCCVTRRTPDGAPHMVSGVCLDITDTLSDCGMLHAKRVGPQLDYQYILENSPDLFIRFDRELAPVYVNPVINKYLGSGNFRGQEGGGRRTRIIGDYKAVFRESVDQVFCRRTAVRKEITLALDDGGEVVGDCTFWPEYNELGELQFAMVQFRDITEQRLMEQRNMLNEKRLEALNKLTAMENANEREVFRFVLSSALSITSSRCGFVFIYSQAGSDKGILVRSGDGYHPDESGKYLFDEYLPEEILAQIQKRGLRSMDNGDGKTPLYRAFNNQTPVWRGITAPVMEGERVVCIAGVCNKARDYDDFDMLQFETFLTSAWLVLRRRRFIRELQKAKNTAEAANKAKDAFLANVSHELRTPLNGVLSMLQLIDSLQLGKQQREYLEVAVSSGKALLRIISDLLDFSCMESGKMSLAYDIFNLKGVVLSACDLFQEDASQKGLAFTSAVDPAIPEFLLGDESRVKQIIFNLVGNSLKFTFSGGIELSCFPYRGPTQAGKQGIMLTVKDSGIGIPAEKLSSIFDAFIQVERRQRRKYTGTGLGLGIVKHLVTLMEGDVSVESKEGVGTSLECLLFFDLPGPDRLAIPYARGMLEQRSDMILDILVAEDDDVGSMAIRAFLKKRGHRVVCVADGREALEALQLRTFHCLFTDITMPDIDGIELVRRIRTSDIRDCPARGTVLAKVREIYPDTDGTTLYPVDRELIAVAVSAHAMIGDREHFIAQGMDLYVSKPIISNELDYALDEVKRRLEQKK